MPWPADAILGTGSGIDYERQRYSRALAATSGGGGGSGSGPAAALEAAPLTAAWMRQVVREVRAGLRWAGLFVKTLPLPLLRAHYCPL